MKSLVVYDSSFGNTEIIAQAIGKVLGEVGKVQVVRPDAVNPADLAAADLLVVGSPTQGGMPTKPLAGFIDSLSGASIEGKRVAAFDTSMTMWIARVLGCAGGRIAKRLEKKGAVLVAPAAAFIVKDRGGPLAEGEVERAADWTREIVNKMKAG
jgi:flavodoxin